MILVALAGCAAPPAAPPGAAGADTGADTDTGEEPGVPAEGPDCTEEAWPVGTPANVLGAHVVAGTATGAVLDDLHALVDAYADRDGPWNHHVAGPFVSADGVTFGEAGETDLSSASVPDAVRDDDGRWWLFYVDGDTDAMLAAAEAGTPLETGWRGFGGLGAAVSDDGAHFERVDITVVGDAVPLYVVDPDLVRLPDGRWRLYYLGVDAAGACADTLDPAGAPGSHTIWAAESDDLLVWEQLGEVYRSADGGADPGVWCVDDTTCNLLLHEMGTPVGAARSTDGGVRFDPYALTLPEVRLGMPDVAELPAGWRMYAQGSKGALFSLASDDGTTWEIERPLGLFGSGPTALAEGEGARVWVHLKD